MGIVRNTLLGLIVILLLAASFLVCPSYFAADPLSSATHSPKTNTPQLPPDDPAATPVPDANAPGDVPPPIPRKQPTVSRHHVMDDPDALELAARKIKLWEPPAVEGSDQLAIAASSVVMWNPKTPADVARDWTGLDFALVHSLLAWQRYISGTRPPNVPDLYDHIQEAVLTCHLTAAQCTEMTGLIALWEDQPGGEKEIAYGHAAGCFARAAILAAAQEAKMRPTTRQMLIKLVSPLVRRTWYGDVHDAGALTQFYSMVATGQPVDSPEYFRGQFGQVETLGREGKKYDALALLSNIERRQSPSSLIPAAMLSDTFSVLSAGGLHEDRRHAFGIAKCLYYLDRPAAAISVIDSINPPLGESDADYQDCGCILAMALINAQRYPRAQEQLIDLVADGHSPNLLDCIAMLIENSIRVGDAAKARYALSLWKCKVNLSTYSEAEYMRRIGEIELKSKIHSTAVPKKSAANLPVSQVPVELDPRNAIGKPLPYMNCISLQQPGSLAQGHFLLVFYHHDCPECRANVPSYQRAAHLLHLLKSDLNVVFVEVPPLADKCHELITPSTDYRLAQLSEETDWFVPMLTRAEIRDGLIVKSWSYSADSTDEILNRMLKE